MQRINTSTAAADLHGEGKNGFTDGDPATGLAATELEAAWFNAQQEEVANVIELSGGTLDAEDDTQLHASITNMINNVSTNVAYATDAVAGTVELATTAEAQTGTNAQTVITPATLKDTLDTAVISTQIADDAVTTAKIADDAVTTAKIADGAVTTAKIADDAITESQIADGAVLATALSMGVGTGAGNLVQLDGTAKLPAVDGSQLTGVSSIPMGTVVPYMFSVAPDDWILVYGQTIYQSQYPKFFTALGLTSSYTLPDLRGRVIAGTDNMGGGSANRLTGQSGGVNGDYLLSTGGAETHTLSTSQMPRHQHGILDEGMFPHASGYPKGYRGFSTRANVLVQWAGTGGYHDHHYNATSWVGSSSSHNNVQPTIIMNMIMRVR